MSKERSYVLRTRDRGRGDAYASVDPFEVEVYGCGLRAGDRVQLKRDLKVVDTSGSPTGQIHPRGELWTVLTGTAAEPGVLWLRQADGELHTWDDDQTVFEVFERVER